MELVSNTTSHYKMWQFYKRTEIYLASDRTNSGETCSIICRDKFRRNLFHSMQGQIPEKIVPQYVGTNSGEHILQSVWDKFLSLFPRLLVSLVFQTACFSCFLDCMFHCFPDCLFLFFPRLYVSLVFIDCMFPVFPGLNVSQTMCVPSFLER